MSNPTASLLPNSQSPDVLERRMHGPTLYLARGIYFVFFLVILGLNIRGIPEAIQEMNATGAFTTFHVVRIFLIYIVGFTVISLLLFVLGSHDWLVFFVALTLLAFGGRSTFIGISPLASFLVHTANVLLMVLFLTFPNGAFVPVWSRRFLWFLLLWTIISFSLDVFRAYIPQLPIAMNVAHWVWQIIWGVGVYAQIYRFRYVASPMERQQVKWVVIVLPFAFLLGIVSLLFYNFYSFTSLTLEAVKAVSYILDTLMDLTNLFGAIGVGLAVYRYKLWETDFYLIRTLVFGTVAALLAALWWFGSIAVQLFLNTFIQQQSSPLMVAILSGIPAAALFQPLRDNTKKWVSTRLYKDQVDLTQVIVELQPENWQFVGLKDMVHAVMKNTARLLDVDKSAIYIFDNGALRLMNSNGVTSEQASQFDELNVSELQKGKTIQLGKGKIFTMLVPFVVPRGRTNDLIGVLALGPRAQGRGYSRDHINNLKHLGERAGTAMHFLQLHEKKEHPKPVDATS